MTLNSSALISRWSRIAVVVTATALAGASAARSHPHVTIESRSDLVFDASGRITAINLEWEFDEYYSVTVVEGMDTNGNGTYEPEELAPLAKENIESLLEYRYFTQANADGEPIEYGAVTKYGSLVKDGKLTLYFSLPLKQPVDPKTSKIDYAIYDPSFYIAIELAPQDPVTLTGSPPKSCAIELVDSEADAADSNNPEAFYEKFSSTEDIGALYAKKIHLDCLRKTAAQ